MKEVTKPITKKTFGFQASPDMTEKLLKAAEVTKRTYSSIIEECLQNTIDNIIRPRATRSRF